MALTWSAFQVELAYYASDEEMTNYTDDQYLKAVNDALRAFASVHTSYAQSSTLTSDGTTTEFDLPTNAVDGNEIYAVVIDDKAVRHAFPGESYSERTWFIWPNGSLQFSTAPETSETVVLRYNAYYPEVEDGDSEIKVPGWAREAIKSYAAAALLLPDAASSANLSQYDQRRDSGNPEHNPLLRVWEKYLEHYWQILNQHERPQYTRF